MECYNFHKKGHMAKDCWAKGGGKEDQNPQRKDQGKANIAQAKSTTNAIWFAVNYEIEQEKINQPPIENKDNNNIPELEDTSRDNSEAKEPEGTYETTEKILLIFANLAAIVTTTGQEHELEIYDSGATQHIIPSHHKLTNFQPIQPQGILAADKKHFEAIGKKDMFVQVSNGDKSKNVKDMLYTPNLGITLLSVAYIIQAGYMLYFKQQDYQILNPKNYQMGTIPITNGLYGIQVKIPLQANTVTEDPLTVTPDELHRLIGYISTNAATKLVKDHLVDRIKLDESQDTPKKMCKSCLYGRMTRKPISKVLEMEASGKMEDKIHTDVWGPAPIEIPQHKRYYITFTNKATHYLVAFLMHKKSETLESFQALNAQ